MTILVEKSDTKITHLKINRPEKRNALNIETIEALISELEKLVLDDDTRIVIISGNGGVFSAGGDINDMPHRFGKALSTKTRLDNGLNMIVRLIRNIRRPVIAMVEGACFGAGMVIATACDVIYTTNETKFGFAYGNVGLIPEASYFVARNIGLNKAKELVFSRAVINGKEAENLNFVNKSLPREDLDAYVMSVAEKWTNGPIDTMGLSKEVLNHAYESTLDEQLKFEGLAQGTAFTTEEHKEGVTAFLEKRKAKFYKV